MGGYCVSREERKGKEWNGNQRRGEEKRGAESKEMERKKEERTGGTGKGWKGKKNKIQLGEERRRKEIKYLLPVKLQQCIVYLKTLCDLPSA